MPAISPARLKKDAEQLFEQLADSEAFDRSLEEVLDFYADRTVRPSQAGRPASLLPAYHVPKPVLRELSKGLAEFAAEEPDEAFRLAVRMWLRGVSEYMLLAIRLLEDLPETENDRVVQRLTSWMLATEDEALLEEIFRVCGTKDPEAALGAAAEMLETRKTGPVISALIGLAALAKRADEGLLPGVFKLLGRLLENPSLGQPARLLALTRALAERSPSETAFFLRQYYLVSMRLDVGRILRQCMPAFPEAIQEDLRKMLRQHAASEGSR